MFTATIIIEHQYCWHTFMALVESGSKSWMMLLAVTLDEAVAETSLRLNLDEDFRDPMEREWDILIPDETAAFELPDKELSHRDRWWKSFNDDWFDDWFDGLPNAEGPPAPAVTLPWILPMRVSIDDTGMRVLREISFRRRF